MKFIISILALMLCYNTVQCQEGTVFHNLTLEQALAKAKAEDKMVFMDCYTIWCGPCKYMDKEIFPQKKMGDFFNSKFICVKFDMERGEGEILKEKYVTTSYPTYFIIRPDGIVQHKLVGSSSPDYFIERVSRGLNEKTSMIYLEKEFQKGKMDNKRLMDYWTMLKSANEVKRAAEIESQLVKRLSDSEITNKYYWSLFENSDYGKNGFNIILKHYDGYKKSIGEEEIVKLVSDGFNKRIDLNNINNNPHLKKLTEQEIAKMRIEIAQTDIQIKDILCHKLDLAEVLATKDNKKIITKTLELLPELSLQEIKAYITIVRYSPDKTQDDLKMIVESGDKIASNYNGSAEEKEQVKACFNSFRLALRQKAN